MSRFYTRKGEVVSQVECSTKPGKFRAPTITDARKHGWLPSVTTITAYGQRANLERWKIRQALLYASIHPKGDLTDDEYLAEHYDAYEQSLTGARDLGSAIHRGIEIYLTTGELVEQTDGYHILDCVEAFRDWMLKSPLRVWEAEKVVTGERYAGRTDILGRWDDLPAVLDIKTQESKSGRKMHAWDEYGMQLAAYGMAWAGESCACFLANVLVSTSEPGRIELIDWTDRKGEMWARFEARLQTWILDHRYDPAEWEVMKDAS